MKMLFTTLFYAMSLLGFGVDEVTVTGAEAPAQSQPTTAQTGIAEPAAAPQVPAEPEWYLDAQTGTRYRTREEAAQGVAQKDQLIEQMRQQYIQQLGVDPISGQRYSQPQQQQPQTQPQGYLNNHAQYVQDLTRGAQLAANGDPSFYAQVQQKFFLEQMEQYLGPYASVLSGVAQNAAVTQLTAQTPGFDKFVDSQDFNRVLQENPSLGGAIQQARQNPRLAQSLSELYSLAYAKHENKLLREQVKKTAVQNAQATQPQQVVRPTSSSSTVVPQLSNGGLSMDRNDPVARKRMIEEGKARGLDNMSLTVLGG